MADLTKGKIGKQDQNRWDGTTSKTFSRPTSTGGTENISYLDDYVDVLATYGSNTDQTATTLSNAIAAIGTSKRTFFLAPGTWDIDSDVTVPSNVTLICPAGCTLSIATTKTLTLSTIAVDAGPYQIFTLNGTGTVSFTDGTHIKSSWFASFEIAVGAISTTKAELEITEANSIAGDLTINANTTLKWTSAGKILTVATTKTLTISTINIDAGPFPIFTFTGTGTATFADGVYLKSSWFENFDEAIAAIDDSKVELEITEAGAVSDDLTINANTWLKWTCGGRALTVANAKTLTVSGGIFAPNVEIFTGTGTVTGTTLADFIQPNWDNAGLAAYTLAIGTTGICTTFIQTLLDDTTAAIARATLGTASATDVGTRILGNGDAAQSLRVLIIECSDGGVAATVNVITCNAARLYYNGTSVSVSNLAKSGTDSGISLGAGGDTMSFSNDLWSGEKIIGIFSAQITDNRSTTAIYPRISDAATFLGNSFTITFNDAANWDNSTSDITTLVDTGIVSFTVCMITEPI